VVEVVLFHHAQGLTPEVIGFADELRREEHLFHTPDLFEGRTLDTLEAGPADSNEIGPQELLDRGGRAVADLPAAVVYLGFSLGALNAQKLTQTGPAAGARCSPAAVFRPHSSGRGPRVRRSGSTP
jgi:dienelactone hydrolase